MASEISKVFGRIVNKLRIHSGIGAGWMAEKLEIPEPVYLLLEKGDIEWPLNYVPIVAEVLDVPAGEMIYVASMSRSVRSAPVREVEIEALMVDLEGAGYGS